MLSTAGMFAAQAKEYFVALNGNDSSPGTKAKPFLTLKAARDGVRNLKQKGHGLSGGVTIWIRGGTYMRSKPFELSAADSGTKGFPVVYRAYQDEEARLLGGQLLKGFKPVSDAAILDRLNEDARKHIFEAELHSQGILDFGELRSRGFGRPISPLHLELFFGGQPMTLARWPSEDEWEKIAGFPEDSAQDVGQRAVHNLIHDHPHCPILYSGNDHRIEWNEIHHVALETGDVGAVYSGRDWTFRGNAIRYNFIHHTGGVGIGIGIRPHSSGKNWALPG